MNENEQGEVEVTEDVVEETETTEHTENEKDSVEEVTEKPKETPQQKKARLERELKQINKKLGVETEPKKKLETKTEGLSDAVLDFFELKGYNDEEVEIFENIMKRTGMTHREVVKDDYATAKIEKMRQERAVKEATPSGTRRSSNSSNDEDYWLAKYEQTGELPKDFELRSKVINRYVDKSNPNKPSWH